MMTATEDSISIGNGKTMVVAYKEKIRTEIEMEEADQQGIDFVTLGMFIIGTLPLCCPFNSRHSCIRPRTFVLTAISSSSDCGKKTILC